MTVVFEMARRGEPKTLEFANVDAFYRHLDVLAKENRRDPFRRRQFWWAREAQTSALLAKWNPSKVEWEIERRQGAEAPLW